MFKFHEIVLFEKKMQGLQYFQPWLYRLSKIDYKLNIHVYLTLTIQQEKTYNITISNSQISVFFLYLGWELKSQKSRKTENPAHKK